MSNLPDGCTIYDLPGCSELDIQRDQALSIITEELQDLIDHFREQYPVLTDDDIKDTLDTVKP